MFPEIAAASVDRDILTAATSESEFVSVGVDLLIEAASYLTIASTVYSDERGWALDEAIVGGNGVRLTKLIQGFLDQTCQQRREISEILARLIFETATHIVYLIRFGDENLFRSYIDYSLRYERRLKALIDRNISERGDEPTAIESRMLDSISRLAEASGVDLSQAPLNKRNWGDRDLFQKADAVGWGPAYLAIFGGMSTAVHGNWGDIVAHHLERFDGSGFYKPCLEWSTPRPQSLLSLSRLIVVVAEEMLAYFGDEPLRAHFSTHFGDLVARLDLATELHEHFLQTL